MPALTIMKKYMNSPVASNTAILAVMQNWHNQSKSNYETQRKVISLDKVRSKFNSITSNVEGYAIVWDNINLVENN